MIHQAQQIKGKKFSFQIFRDEKPQETQEAKNHVTLAFHTRIFIIMSCKRKNRKSGKMRERELLMVLSFIVIERTLRTII